MDLVVQTYEPWNLTFNNKADMGRFPALPFYYMFPITNGSIQVLLLSL